MCVRVCERACECVCECGLGLWVGSLVIVFSGFVFPAAVVVAYAGVRQRKRGVRLWSLRWRKEA